VQLTGRAGRSRIPPCPSCFHPFMFYSTPAANRKPMARRWTDHDEPEPVDPANPSRSHTHAFLMSLNTFLVSLNEHPKTKRLQASSRGHEGERSQTCSSDHGLVTFIRSSLPLHLMLFFTNLPIGMRQELYKRICTPQTPSQPP
jgi:hypothetical protein